MLAARYARPMRSIEYYIILTADGMYADPDGGLDHYDPADDEHRYANELLRTAGVEVMGRAMYDVMSYWDQLDVDDPATPEVGAEFARYWRETPKLVVSRGTPSWVPTRRSSRATSSRRSARSSPATGRRSRSAPARTCSRPSPRPA